MKQVYLKKAKHSQRFNYTFPNNVPLTLLSYGDRLMVVHPEREGLLFPVRQNDFRDVVTHNEKDINTGGTSFMGDIVADYADLKKAFGKPLDGDGYKVDAEWELEFPDGKVAIS